MTRADVQPIAPTRTFEERNALGVIAEAHTLELHCGSVQQPARGQSQRQLLVLVQVRQVVLYLLACNHRAVATHPHQSRRAGFHVRAVRRTMHFLHFACWGEGWWPRGRTLVLQLFQLFELLLLHRNLPRGPAVLEAVLCVRP